MKIELGNTFPAYMLVASDLTAETVNLKEQGEDFECFNLCEERENGQYDRNAGEMLWVPGLNRAGIFRGADSQWTDATSAQDALDRYNAGEMAR